jgi:hypothetical protein
MMFQTPGNNTFEIPDEWWNFAEMSNWSRGEYPHYPPQRDQSFHRIPVRLIEPPVRDPGVDLFRKYKMVPILFALRSPECSLPPIRVSELCGDNTYLACPRGMIRV